MDDLLASIIETLDYTYALNEPAVEVAIQQKQRVQARHRRATARYRLRHPDKVRARHNKVRAAIYARDGGHCHWCGIDVGDSYHVDHVMPLARGGANTRDNLVLSCPACNMSKGALLPEVWLWRRFNKSITPENHHYHG